MCPANRSWHDLDGRWMRVQKTERSEDQNWKKTLLTNQLQKEQSSFRVRKWACADPKFHQRLANLVLPM